jgi:succinate dehydrogenase/fumarate reductase cytochrome b subunit
MAAGAAAIIAASVAGSSAMQTLIIVAFLLLIIYNLGAGLYYMLTDRDGSKRTVNALTKRIALSVVLVLLVIAGIASGIIQPHGIQR